ncbi:MAG: hypothetical protein HQ522_07320 [Bacteroidetes bacterium]|nr:hypothetical protein [Bacteroidota bacterium]
MNKEKIENLIEKYEAGASTLQEEQFLFDNAENSDPTIEAWSAFVKHKKKVAPQNLNDSLWASIQTRKIKKRSFVISIMSTAATVLLFIFISVNYLSSKKMSYKEKEALLSEALSMLDIQKQIIAEQSIIYEDEMIIIYSATE